MTKSQRAQEREERIRFCEDYARTHPDATNKSTRLALRQRFEGRHKNPTISTDTIGSIVKAARASRGDGVTDLRSARGLAAKQVRAPQPPKVFDGGGDDPRLDRILRAMDAVKKYKAGARVVIGLDDEVSIVFDR